MSEAADTNKGRQEPWHTFHGILSQAFERGHLGTKWLPCDCAVGVDAQYHCGWSKVSDPCTIQLTPSTHQKNRGIMQTEQAGAIRERLDGLSHGDAEDEVMAVGAPDPFGIELEMLVVLV